jgi:thioredoxin 1
MKKLIVSIILIFAMVLVFSEIDAQNKKAKVTFIELGSDKCIPCKKMKPVMESLEKRYGEQLEIIFYDVWTDEHKDKSGKYKIKLIPTQIFLDAKGKEIHRHEGFYPEAEIDKFLKKRGLKAKG